MKRYMMYLMILIMSSLTYKAAMATNGYVDIPNGYPYVVTIYYDDYSNAYWQYDYNISSDDEKISVWATSTGFGVTESFSCDLTQESAVALHATPGYQYYYDVLKKFGPGGKVVFEKSSTVGPASEIRTCHALMVYGANGQLLTP